MAVFADTTLPQRRYEAAVIGVIVILVGVRLICAAATPLSFDEALYWIWSKHLAGGYYDHPPINPILIRLGTTLFGNNEFGVRVAGVLLGLPASWAVWRSAAILFRSERIGATAALYFNLTLAMAVGSLLATPDNPLVISAAFLLFTLAKLAESGRAQWWLAIGVAFGVGMLSKYTTIFFAVSILAWLLLVPEQRKWLATPWPWIGGVIAVVVFSPTLIWNAQHHWASFLYNYNRRLIVHELTLSHLPEFVLSQVGMVTPPVFVLGGMGLARMLRGEGGAQVGRVLIGAMVWPLALYFTWHSFHQRVEGNWPEPAYVAFVVAAAVAVEAMEWNGAWAGLLSWSKRLALPVGLGMAAIIYAQGIFGILPLGGDDPTARKLGAGWRELAAKIDALRVQAGAPVILTDDYALTGWLAFYLPSHAPVEQINRRIRYVDAPQPDPALFRGTMMFVCESPCARLGAPLLQRFATVNLVAHLERTPQGVPVGEYDIYKLAGPTRPVLDSP